MKHLNLSGDECDARLDVGYFSVTVRHVASSFPLRSSFAWIAKGIDLLPVYWWLGSLLALLDPLDTTISPWEEIHISSLWVLPLRFRFSDGAYPSLFIFFLGG